MSVLLEIFIWVAVLLGALTLFSLSIFAHELGHYLLARWRGLVVEEFAVGLGPVLFSKTIQGVPWNFRAIPFGGYVKLPQLAHMESIEGKNEMEAAGYPAASPWSKILAAFGGPLFSALFGLLLATVVWLVGKPVAGVEATRVIGYITPDGPAAKATPPLKTGDQVVSIDGKAVTGFFTTPYSIVEAVAFSTGSTIHFEVDRPQADGRLERVTTDIVPLRNAEGRRQVQIGPANETVVDTITPGSPADKAGLRQGDEIRAVDGERIYSPFRFRELAAANPGRELSLTVVRGGREERVALVPVAVPEEGSVKRGDARPTPDGIEMFAVGAMGVTHPAPWRSVKDSLISIKRTVGAVTDSRSDVRVRDMSGPIGILHGIFLQMRTDFRRALWFMVVININLAVLNLLPIPIVDGGHILLSFLEAIRRRPLPARAVEWVSYACLALILSFMLYVTTFDVRRLWQSVTGSDAPAKPKSPPATAPAK